MSADSNAAPQAPGGSPPTGPVSSAPSAAYLFGAVVVRLSDRMMLCKVPGMPTEGFTIPGTAWAEIVSKCTAPHFRTSAYLNVTSDDVHANEVQLSYHVLTDDAVGYGIIAAKEVSRRQGHAALDELAALFKKMFVESPAKLSPKTVDVFAKPARELLTRLSGVPAGGAPGEEKVRKVKLAVDEVKSMALDNVERVIQRGQHIDDIVQATDDLQFQAQGFQRSSRELSNQLWWNSMKGKLIMGGAAGLFILIVLFTFFGGNGDKK